MNEDSDLKILIEATLDLERSIQNILQDMRQVQERLRSYHIKITAGLDQAASTSQIRQDLQKLNKTKNHIDFTGKIDQAAMKAEVEKAIKRLRNTEIKLSAVLDPLDAARQFQNSLPEVPSLDAKAEVTIEGTEQVAELSRQMEATGKNASGMVAQLYLARTALSALRTTAREAIQAVSELDGVVTDLAMATGESREATYDLLRDYNELAKELGATTVQVSQAADEWLRQGHSIADTTTLIQDSMILSKVSQLDSANATEYLTSAMKGYKIAAQDVIGVVDKLSAVDLVSATDAGGLAEAMSRTAVTADMAGVSMDRLLGYLATVGEVTQKSMSSVGESFKTIFARMNDIKSNKLELVDEDGTVETLSDVELTLKNVGIDLRATVNEYNNYGDVLDDLADKWDTLSAVQQNALAKAFAGTRQGENFRVLMENYADATKYMNVAADSIGTATEKFALYEDSLEAKSAAFSAAVEGLVLDTVDTDFVGDLIEAGTAVVEFADGIGVLKSALLGLGVGGLLKGVTAVAEEFNAAKQNVLDLGAAIQTLRSTENVAGLSGDTIKTLGTLCRSLGDEQLKLVLTSGQLSAAQMQAILTSSGLTDAQAAQKLETLGLASAQSTAVMSTTGLSTAMTGLGASIKAAFAANPVGMVMLAVSAVGMLAQGVISLHDALTETAEEATEAMEESFSAFENAANTVSGLNDELETTRERIAELESKDSLTFIEGSELQKLREANELLEIQADLAEKERARAARDAAEDTVRAYRKNFDSEISQSKVDEYIDRSNNSGNNASLFFDETDISALLAGTQQMEKLRDACDKSSEDYTHFQTVIQDTTDNIWDQVKILTVYKENLEAIPYDELSDNQKQALEEIDGAIQLVYQTLEPAKWQEKQWNKIAGSDEYKNDVQALQQIAADTGVTIDTIREQFPALAQACTTAGLSMDGVVENLNALADAQNAGKDTAETYTAKLSELPDVLAKLKDSYDVAATAEAEMATGGLSPKTIKALADVEDNYLSYLYEENGVVKLNTEAWRENANAKMESEKGEIEKEIESLKKRNQEIENSLPSIREYIDLMNEVESLGIAQSKTVFGNIDTNNRQVLEWTEENLKLYEDALKSWDTSVEEMRGTISTVFGGSSEYDGIEIAFSPMLQTENGAVLLDRDTVDRYIFGLIESAGEDWTAQDLLRLDTRGLEIDGLTIKNLLADIGDTAIQTGEAMHFVGANGAIASMKQYLQEAGAAAGFTETEITNLTEEFISNASAIESDNELLSIYSAFLDEISGKAAFSPAFLEQFSTVEQNIKSLTDVLGDFEKGTAASASTLKELYQTFGDLGSFEQFIKVTANTKSSMEEVRDAANALAEEYINSIGILDNLTESNASVIESLLEEMGVTNAHEVVMARLNATRLEAVLAANGMADAVWEDAEALLEESGAADNTIQYLKLLRQEQYNAQISAINFKNATSDVIAALAQQAAMAGVTADKMAALQKAQSLITRKESGALDEYEANNYGDILDRYLKQAQADIGSIDVKVPEIKVSVPRGSSSGKSGSSSSSKASKEVEE